MWDGLKAKEKLSLMPKLMDARTNSTHTQRGMQVS